MAGASRAAVRPRVLVLLLGVGACALMGAETPALAGLHLRVTTDKNTYAPGDPILVTLWITNRAPQPKTLRFRTAQRYDVVIEDGQQRQAWRWSEGQMFTQVLGEETLEPGRGSITYRVAVRARLAPGAYTVTGIVPAEDGRLSSSATIRIE